MLTVSPRMMPSPVFDCVLMFVGVCVCTVRERGRRRSEYRLLSALLRYQREREREEESTFFSPFQGK